MKSEKIPTRSELLPFGPMEPFNAVGERHPAMDRVMADHFFRRYLFVLTTIVAAGFVFAFLVFLLAGHAYWPTPAGSILRDSRWL